MHLEQTGSELMFVQINDNDTGDYHCEATNYLGKVTSEPFRLTVQTSKYQHYKIVTLHRHFVLLILQLALVCFAYSYEHNIELHLSLEPFLFLS